MSLMALNANGSIYETGSVTTTGVVSNTIAGGISDNITTGCYQTYYWGNYPVYVCTDKTKKAIDIVKALEAAKHLKITSVPKFLALVEEIAGLLE